MDLRQRPPAPQNPGRIFRDTWAQHRATHDLLRMTQCGRVVALRWPAIRSWRVEADFLDHLPGSSAAVTPAVGRATSVCCQGFHFDLQRPQGAFALRSVERMPGRQGVRRGSVSRKAPDHVVAAGMGSVAAVSGRAAGRVGRAGFERNDNMELNGADIVVRCLAEEGVEHVFGYPAARCFTSTTRFSSKTNSSISWSAMSRPPCMPPTRIRARRRRSASAS